MTKGHISRFLLATASLLTVFLSGCRDIDAPDASAYGTFDAVWTTIDRHYCFLDSKHIDWDDVGNRYRAMLRPSMRSDELFAVCARMLDELRDGHVNLSSGFDVSYYRDCGLNTPKTTMNDLSSNTI